MECSLLLVMVFVISVNTAPYIPVSEHWTQMNQPLDQQMLNHIAQQSMEQWILRNRYNSMQQQMMAVQHLQGMKNTHGSVPALFNLPQQSLLLLVPTTIAKTTNRLENLNEKDEPDFKHSFGDADTVVINSEKESNVPEINMVPQRAIVVLPNGQRMIIGSIISAIPFLPFEVNVPDTIGWIYNGIAGIIGGIGQRLPFRPKPTTERPASQESMPSAQESLAPIQGSITLPSETEMMSTQDSRINLMQKLLSRRPNVGMPILMLPMAQTVPIQVPIQV